MMQCHKCAIAMAYHCRYAESSQRVYVRSNQPPNGGLRLTSLRVITVLFCSLFAAHVQATEPLRLVGDDFCPYNCDAASGKPGYIVEVLEEIFAAQGVAVKYQIKPWSRAMRMVAKGDADVLLANTYNSAPDPQLQLVMGEDSTCFLTRSDASWRFTDMADLYRQRFGVIQGYHYDSGGPLDQHLRSNNPLVYQAKGESPLRSLLLMLMQKRVDLVLENCNVLRNKVNKMKVGSLTQIAGVLPGYRADLHIAFSPADPDATRLMNIVREGVADMRRTGRLAAILQRYSVPDWEQTATTP